MNRQALLLFHEQQELSSAFYKKSAPNRGALTTIDELRQEVRL